MDYGLLQQLTATPGVSGREETVADLVAAQLAELGAEVNHDSLGNVIGHFPGQGPRLALSAHLDEVGLIVSKIEPGGFLRVLPLGEVAVRSCLSQAMILHSREEMVGLLCASTPSPFETGASKEPGWADCFLDLGRPDAEIAGLIRLGDTVTFPPAWHENQTTLMAKALDDRVGLFVMLEAVRAALAAGKIEWDLYLIGTVQEEIGIRGAAPAATAVTPEIFIALEGTFCTDTPGNKPPTNLSLPRLGFGPEIRVADRVLLSDRKLVYGLASLADQAGLKRQIVVKNFGNTDASRFQVTGRGCRAVAVSVPVRYLHCPLSLASKDDIAATISLMTLVLGNAGLGKS